MLLYLMLAKTNQRGLQILPGLKFTRTKTIGAGDDLCDFKMEIV